MPCDSVDKVAKHSKRWRFSPSFFASRAPTPFSKMAFRSPPGEDSRLHYSSLSPSLSTRATTSEAPSPPAIRRHLSVPKKRCINTLGTGQSISTHFEFLSTINGSTQVNLQDLFKPPTQPSNRVVKPSSRPVLLKARERSTGVECVAKILRKSTIPPSSGGERLWRELCTRILQCPSHPNLLPFYGIFEDDTNYYLFFEQLMGGELFDFLLTESAVPEELCKHLVRQILLALEFLHSQDIVHRDVKPENLMFRYKRPLNVVSTRTDKSGSSLLDSLPEMLAPYELVLIDFDTCRMMDLSADDYQEWVGGRRRLVGTYGYLAPEVLVNGEYSPASDLWSVGVILYVLMTGIPPVPMGLMKNVKTSHDELKKLEAKGIDYDFPPLPDFPLARDLCSRLLEFNPKHRITSATDALRHPWLLSSATLSAKYYVASPLAQMMPYAVFQWASPQPQMSSKSVLSLPPQWDPLAGQGKRFRHWQSKPDHNEDPGHSRTPLQQCEPHFNFFQQLNYL